MSQLPHASTGDATAPTVAASILLKKWGKAGAKFTGELLDGADLARLPFTFDEALYEVTIHSDLSLSVVELKGEGAEAVRVPVTIPRGLTLPVEFKRSSEKRG